jgi:photosystem I subunit VIII
MIGSYAASFLPVVLVPLVGLVSSAVAMGLLFTYVESDV